MDLLFNRLAFGCAAAMGHDSSLRDLTLAGQRSRSCDYVSEIAGKSGSRLLFVHLATREETGDRIPVTDERRECR